MLPYRNPVLSAKAVASLDDGLGGPRALRVAPDIWSPSSPRSASDFAERDTLADEAIRAMKAAWRRTASISRRHFVAQGHTSCRVRAAPHPPIWVGGNSKRAIRRAVELGDGWMPIFKPATHASRRRTHGDRVGRRHPGPPRFAAEHARAVGRTGAARGRHPGARPRRIRHGPLRLRRLPGRRGRAPRRGVTYLVVNLPAITRAEHARASLPCGGHPRETRREVSSPPVMAATVSPFRRTAARSS